MKNERKLLMATGSKTKIAAWNLLFEMNGVEDVCVSFPEDMGFEHIEVEERSDAEATYFDNALLKAKAYWDKYHVPVLADDSGLEIMKLDKWPGICTARCNGGVRGAVSEFIVDKMKEYTDWNDRRCRYCTHAVFIDAFGHIFSCFMARDGFIAEAPKGDGNCVEVIFIPDEGDIPSSDNPFSVITLGEMVEEQRCGQQFQSIVLYPSSDDVPKLNFVDIMRVMSNDYKVAEENITNMDDFKDVFVDILDFVTIKKLPVDDIYEFTYPKNPQKMAEYMMCH